MCQALLMGYVSCNIVECNWCIDNPYVGPPKIMFGQIKGRKLCNVKCKSFGPIERLFSVYRWLCAHAMFGVTCIPAFVGASDVIILAPQNRSVRLSPLSCPLYNSYTNWRIFFKLGWNVHLKKGMCRTHVAQVSAQGQGHNWRSNIKQ